MSTRRIHVIIPEAAEEKLMRYRQRNAIAAATGAWKDKDHPELKAGVARYISKLRRQDEERFRKVTSR